MDNIAVQKVPLSSKVMMDREDYEALATAAKVCGIGKKGKQVDDAAEPRRKEN